MLLTNYMIDFAKAYKMRIGLSTTLPLRMSTRELSSTNKNNKTNSPNSFDMFNTLLNLGSASLSAASSLTTDPIKRQYVAAMSFRIGWFVSQYAYRQTNNNNNGKIVIPTVSALLQAMSKRVLGVDFNFNFNISDFTRTASEEKHQEEMAKLRESFFAAFADLITTDLNHITQGNYKVRVIIIINNYNNNKMPHDLSPDLNNPQWNPLSVADMLLKMDKDIPKVSID